MGEGGRVGTYCPAVEVLSHTEDNGFILGYPLDFVTPFPSNFDSGLDCFRAGVHW